jgi:hypothetical protein
MNLERSSTVRLGKVGAAVIWLPHRRRVDTDALPRDVSVGNSSEAINYIAGVCEQHNLRIFITANFIYIVGVAGKIEVPSSGFLADQLHKAGVSDVIFRKGTKPEEIKQTLDALSDRETKAEDLEEHIRASVHVKLRYRNPMPEDKTGSLSLEELLKSPDYYSEEAARDPSTSPDVLDGLARRSIDVFPRAASRIHELIAVNPNVLPDTLRFFLERGDLYVLMVMAKCRNMSEDIVENLAGSRYESVRMAVAETTEIPEILRKLCTDSSFSITSIAAEKPKTPPDAVASAIVRFAYFYDVSNRWQKSNWMRRVDEILSRHPNNRGEIVEELRKIRAQWA